MLGVLKRHWRPKRGNSRRKSKEKSTTPLSDVPLSPNNNDVTASGSLLVSGSTSGTNSGTSTATATSGSNKSTPSPPTREHVGHRGTSPRETTSKICRLQSASTKSPLKDHGDNCPSTGQLNHQVNQVTILVEPKDKNRVAKDGSGGSPLKKNKFIPVPKIRTSSKDSKVDTSSTSTTTTTTKNTSSHSIIPNYESTTNEKSRHGGTWTKDTSVLSPLRDDGLVHRREFLEETWNDHKTEDSKKDLSDKEVTTLLTKESSWSSDDNTVVSKDIAEHKDSILIRENDLLAAEKVLDGEDKDTVVVVVQVDEIQRQKEDEDNDDEKSDPVKEHLELQVEELRAQLELQGALLTREQEQLSQMHLQSRAREGLRAELEREKMLRAEAEVRLREVRLENECCKARLATLQEDFRKMEEMVRDMIQFKTRIDQLKHEKSSLALTYESKMRKYQTYIASLEKENFMLLNELKSVEISSERQDEQDRSLSRVLLERVRLLEQENATLSLENEQQRLQYEHCLDDVANQVVQALLAQKNLREECGKLQLRVQELEQQNRSLSHVFKTHFARPIPVGLGEVDLWPSRLRADSSEIVLPFNNTPFQDVVIGAGCIVRQEAPRDSPNTSQSEDSTESLASLCSDYSLHSSGTGSGVYRNSQSQDHQKMSSPPKWLLEQSINRPAATALAVITAASSSSSSSLGVNEHLPKCNAIWSDLLQKAEMNCLNDEQSTRKITSEAQDDVRKEDWKQAFLRERGNSRGRWSVLRASSEIGDLDSMDTPSDETAPFDAFSLANTRFRLSFPPALTSTTSTTTSSSADDVDTRHRTHRASIIFPPPPAPSSGVYENSEDLMVASSTSLIYNPTRPTTLNIVPHIMGDPSSNFSGGGNYQSLERKSHVVNKSGNMYEELDLPVFPAPNRQVPSSTNETAQMNTNSFEAVVNYPERELSALTNTVVRKTSSFNQVMTSSGDTVICNVLKNSSAASNVSSPTLPPPPCDILQDASDVSAEKRSPLVVTEHSGKDEGYSTMSSDVQCENNDPNNTILPSTTPGGKSVATTLPLPDTGIIVANSLVVKDYREGVMASSSDSGLSLGLQRFSSTIVDVNARDTLEEEEKLESPPSSTGFERELDNSLIRRRVKIEDIPPQLLKDDKDDASPPREPEDNLGDQLDSGLGDSPQAHRVSSFSEPPDFGLADDEDSEKRNDKSLHRSSLDPSYDKILTLLTPRGFRPPCPGGGSTLSPHRSCKNSDAKIETAEKATFTEPEAYFQTEFASDGSLYSVDCGNAKGCADNNSCDGDCESSTGFLQFEPRRQHSPLTTSIPASKTFPWYDASDIYAVACRYCRSRGAKHELEFATRGDALGSLLRAFSDSHLVVKKTNFEQPVAAMRSDSLGTRCPPLRLNLLPLERHASAIDLSPVSEPILETIIKKDNDQRAVKSAHWVVSRLPSEHRPSPSLSLSTVHSSSSGEVAIVDEDEELGATSLKCSRERDISSESDNDILEHNNLVEQWLQKGSGEIPSEISQKLAGFAYDEEEIGNWSFQLSTEDLSQAERWTCVNYDNPSGSERSITQKLEKIKENANVEFHEDFWSAPPFWASKNDKERPASTEEPGETFPQVPPPASSGTFIRAPKVSPIEEKCENSVVIEPEVSNEIMPKVDVENHRDTDTMGKNQSTNLDNANCRCGEDGHNLCAACEEGLQAEVCLFNRDFYRLCSTDSTRSLAASSRSLSECACLEHAHLKQQKLSSVNAEPLLSSNQNQNEMAHVSTETITKSKRKPISSATFRKKRTSDTLPKVDLPVVGDIDDKDIKEAKETSSSTKERKSSSARVQEISGIPITGNKAAPEKRKSHSDKTRIPVSTSKMSAGKSPISNSSKEQKLNYQSEIVTNISKHSSSSSSHSRRHHGHHRSSSANNEERSVSKRHAERNKIQRSFSEENRSQQQHSPKHASSKESTSRIVGGNSVISSSSSRTTSQTSRPSSNRRSPSKRERSGDKRIPKPVMTSRKNSLTIIDNELVEGEKSENPETQRLEAPVDDNEKRLPKRTTSTIESSSLKDNSNGNSVDQVIQLPEVKRRDKNAKRRRSKEGCGTSWVHFETDVDLSDPKARANLLDSMMASSSSSGGTDSDEEPPSIAPSTVIGKIEEELEEDDVRVTPPTPPVKEKEEVTKHTKHQKLQALHRFRRQKKKVSDPDAVISVFPRLRASIIDRHDFYYRFGEKEQEAVACFDFLDDLSTSPSDVDSCDQESFQNGACASGICEKIRRESYRGGAIESSRHEDNYLEALDLGGSALNSSTTDKYSNRMSLDESKLFSRKSSPHDSFSSTTLNSQDFGDHISLSDSCAESYNSSTNSLNKIM